MSNTQLTPYKENIFTKILNFFRNLFKKKQYVDTIDTSEKIPKEEHESQNFKNHILYQQEKDDLDTNNKNTLREQEKQRIMKLKTKYDNGEISIKEIESKDMEMLMKLYNVETEVINKNIERKTKRIINMLNELKQSI